MGELLWRRLHGRTLGRRCMGDVDDTWQRKSLEVLIALKLVKCPPASTATPATADPRQEAERLLWHVNSARPNGCFKVLLVKRDKASKVGITTTGLQVSPVGPCLVVVSINDGLMKEWNEQNPQKKVRVGDSIIQVNNDSGQVSLLYEAIARHDALRLVVVPGQETFQLPV